MGTEPPPAAAPTDRKASLGSHKGFINNRPGPKGGDREKSGEVAEAEEISRLGQRGPYFPILLLRCLRARGPGLPFHRPRAHVKLTQLLLHV